MDDAPLCTRHAGDTKASSANRSQLDHIMAELPSNQSGVGRHSCPYCAYERGLQDGLERGKTQS